MEHAAATATLQAQLKEAASRIERLERHRALLVGKEREAEEREKERRVELDKLRLQAQEETRGMREELLSLRDQHAELGAAYRDLKHASKQVTLSVESQAAEVSALHQELEQERRVSHQRLEDMQRERERRQVAEAELERERAQTADTANVEIIKEELHRA